MRNKILLLVLCMLLQGCLQYTKAGAILPENPQYYNEESTNGTSHYNTVISFSENIYSSKDDYNKQMSFMLPNRINDIQCKTVIGIFLPFYIGDSCASNFNKSNEFIVNLYKPYYTPEFFDNVSILLKYRQKTYQGQRVNGYAGSNKYIQFQFPVTIKNIEENGAIMVINYKNFHKELPIGYKLMWYQG